jgi:DNA-directed RNA polymerase specialized sigma24 family protein
MFPQTPWTLIAAATLNGDRAGRRALESICAVYRPAVLSFLHGKLCDLALAEDVTQDFFLQLIESRLWERADRGRGRFRNFLLGAVMRVLAEEWRWRYAQKRGAGQSDVSLDDMGEVPQPSRDDQLQFDRAWAERVLEHAMDQLQEEWGEGVELAVLQRFLPLQADAQPAYEVAAVELGCSLGALKSRVMRFRQRFRELVEQAVVRTVSDPLDVAEEVQHLQRVLMQ